MTNSHSTEILTKAQLESLHKLINEGIVIKYEVQGRYNHLLIAVKIWREHSSSDYDLYTIDGSGAVVKVYGQSQNLVQREGGRQL